jgi:phage-related protein
MNWGCDLASRNPERNCGCQDRCPSGRYAKRFLRLAERIASVGLESLSEPHVKHLEGKLWELRLTGRDGIARALYVTAIGRRLVVVRAFVKKTQRTPRSEIEPALRRAKEIP